MRIFRFHNKKLNIIRTVVVLLLVALIVVGVSYSWIEDVKLVQITTVENAENTPLKAGVDINSEVIINSTDNEVDLGYMLQSSDLLRGGNGDDKDRIIAGLSPNVDSDLEDMTTVHQKKGYFYESGNMHLSPCYSDGTTFYFPVRGTDGDKVTSGTTYRLANKNDENVNYIDFTFYITCNEGNAAVWFSDVPHIKDESTTLDIVNARFAITADNNTKVLSLNGTDVHSVSGVSATDKESVFAEKLSKYTYGHPDNKTDDKYNNNVLFTVRKGETKPVNIKIWLEEGASSSINLSDVELKLTTSLSQKRKIYFNDKTTGAKKDSWVYDDSARLFLAIPQAYKDNGNSWQDNKSYWEITDHSGSKYAEIPAQYNNQQMFIFRCNSSGFDHGADGRDLPMQNVSYRYNDTDYTGNDPYYAKLDGAPAVEGWNYWAATLPDTFSDETYTVYGGSLDDNAVGRIVQAPGIPDPQDIFHTYKGYGTWGGVKLIKIKNDSNSNCAPWKTQTSGRKTYICNMFVFDYSDVEKTDTQEVYRYTMYYNGTQSDGDSSGTWQVYMPATSTKLQFFYFWVWENDGTDWRDLWGYNTKVANNTVSIDVTENGEERPAESDTYLMRGSAGVGQWNNGMATTYLIASGNISNQSTKKAYFWAGNKNNGWPGASMEPSNPSTVTKGSNTYNVFKIQYEADAGYENVIFNNGGDSVKSPNLTLFANKYYDFAENKWYASLADYVNSGETTTDGNLAESIDGNGTYVYGRLDGTNKNKYMKLTWDSSSNKYSASLHMDAASSGERYFRIVRVTNGSTKTQYGPGNDQAKTFNTSTNWDYNVTGNNEGWFTLTVSSAGTYKFSATNPNSGDSITVYAKYISSN